MSKIKSMQLIFDDGDIVTTAIPEDQVIGDMLSGLYPLIITDRIDGIFMFVKNKEGGFRFFSTGKEIEEDSMGILAQRNNIK